MTVASGEIPPAPSHGGDASEAIKQAELEVRRLEAAASLRAASAPWWRKADPLVLAVMAGVLTLIGNFAVALYNGSNSTDQEREKAGNALALEREKAKTTLILQAVSTNDPATAQRNMLFFLDSGLLLDQDAKIRTAVQKYTPVLPSGTATATTLDFSPEGYEKSFWSMTLRPEKVPAIDTAIAKLVTNRAKFESVGSAVHSPWYVVATIWLRETGGNFNVHLHNGDPLTARTTHVPAGRPLIWPTPAGQDPWAYSAIDALQFFNMGNLDEVPLGQLLAKLEQYNGFGYRVHQIPSPYLWNFTNVYEKGEFGADGRFDPQKVSQLVGTAAILRRMNDNKVVDLRGQDKPTSQR